MHPDIIKCQEDRGLKPPRGKLADNLGNAVSIPALAMYDMLCQVVGKLEEVSTSCDTAIAKCKEEIASLINKNGQPKRGNPNNISILTTHQSLPIQDSPVTNALQLQY